MERFVKTVILPALVKDGYYLARNMMVKDAVNAQYVLGKHTVSIWLTREDDILFVHGRVDSNRRNEILSKFMAVKEIGTDEPQIIIEVDALGILGQIS